MKLDDIVTEGPLGYLKGVGSHVAKSAYDKLATSGQQIMAPIQKAHNIGKSASLNSDIDKTVKMLIDLVKNPTGSTTSRPQQPAQQPVRRPVQRANGRSPSSVRNTRTDPTFEGFMDYLKGAGGTIKGAVQHAHATGQEQSRNADIQKKEHLKSQLVAKLVNFANRLGPKGQQIILRKIMDNGVGPATPLYKQLKTLIFSNNAPPVNS